MMTKLIELESSCSCCLARPFVEIGEWKKVENRKGEINIEGEFDEAITRFKNILNNTDDYQLGSFEIWNTNLPNASEGFYIIDGDKYSEIINNYRKQDVEFRERKNKEVKKNLPILSESKKFKNVIGNELENRIILNPVLLMEARAKLENDSSFIHIKEIDDLDVISQMYDPLGLFDIQFFAKYAEDNFINQFILKLSKQKNDEERDERILTDEDLINSYDDDIKRLIEKGEHRENIGSFTAESEKFIFFDNHTLTTNNPQSYKENFIKCQNGTYTIQKIYDSQFKENLEKGKLLREEFIKQKLTFEDASGFREDDNYIENILTKKALLYMKEYLITDPGMCIYYINFAK